jgi:hypothetical protein
MSSHSKTLLLFLLLTVVIAAGTIAFWGLHQQYIPPEAVKTSRRFISLIEYGNLREAYEPNTNEEYDHVEDY